MITLGTFLLYYLTEKSYKNPINRFKRNQIIILNGPPSPPIDTDLTVLSCLFVCLFGIAIPQVGLPGPSDFVDRSLTPGKDQCIS